MSPLMDSHFLLVLLSAAIESKLIQSPFMLIPSPLLSLPPWRTPPSAFVAVQMDGDIFDDGPLSGNFLFLLLLHATAAATAATASAAVSISKRFRPRFIRPADLITIKSDSNSINF